MIKTLVSIIVSSLLFVALLGSTGCGTPVRVADPQNTSASWWIEKSPVTGRYYEVYYQVAPRGLAMSEVTELEYLDYLDRVKKAE